jgi:hypothetical protein
MESSELRALQAPLKDRYREDPASAVVTLRAEGRWARGFRAASPPGARSSRRACIRRPAAPGMLACSGDMLLQALVRARV